MQLVHAKRCLAALVASFIVLALPATASAALDPSPTTYDWGNVDRYQQSPQQNFTFTNNEGFGVNPQTQVTGPDAGSFQTANPGCSGQFVPDGGSCTVTLYVNPQNTGPLSASLDVDDGNGIASVPLAATAMTGTLHTSPDPIDFNPQPWFYGGQNTNANIQALDYGVSISNLQITGPDQALFSINFNDCFAHPLLPVQNCSVNIGFNPTGPSGPANANLVITSDGNGSPQSVAIAADALSGPEEQITPNTKDFGPVALGSASGPQTFTMTNVGDSPDQIQQVFPVSGSPQSFPVSNDNCTLQVVPPGDSCTFDVSFAPAAAGAKEASIFVISSGPAPVTQVGLSGQAYEQPGVAAVIDGTPEVGKTLDCNPINANGDLSFEWLRNGAAISGAEDSSYELGSDDFGALISCRITASNPVGSTSADSPQTGPVGARNLSDDTHSLVDETTCRLVQIEPISGVNVSGTDPATPESPLTLSAKKRIDVQLGSLEQAGSRVRFNPRQLASLDDGPQPLTVNGKTHQAVLAPCMLSGQVSGSRRGRITYAISGSTGIRSGSIKTPKLSIRPRGRSIGEVSIFAYGRPNVRFPIGGKSTSYNGIRVQISHHGVKVSGLLDETSLIEVDLDGGVVRGSGGRATVKASLQGQGDAKAGFRTAWR